MKQTLKLKAAILALVGTMIFALSAQAAPKKAKAPAPSPSPSAKSSPVDPTFFEYSPYPGFEYNTYGYGMEGGWVGKNEDLVKADLGEEPIKGNPFASLRPHKTAPIGEFTVEWKGWTKPEQLRIILGATVTWWVREGIQNMYNPALDDYYMPMIVKVYDASRHYICQWAPIPDPMEQKVHPLGYLVQEPWTPSVQNLKEINAAVKRASSKLVHFVLFSDPTTAFYYQYCPSWTHWGFSLWSLRKDEVPSYAEAVRNSKSVVVELQDKKKRIDMLTSALVNFREVTAEDFVSKALDNYYNLIEDYVSFLIPLMPARAIEAGEYEFVNNRDKGNKTVMANEEEYTFQSVPSELHRTGKKQFDTDFPDHIVLDVNYLRERLRLMKSRGETPWDPYMQSVFDKYLAAVGK